MSKTSDIELLDPKFADRIARRIIVLKREGRSHEAQVMVRRLLGKAAVNRAHPVYKQVTERIHYWNRVPNVSDKEKPRT